jgi:hypothetical protein
MCYTEIEDAKWAREIFSRAYGTSACRGIGNLKMANFEA